MKNRVLSFTVPTQKPRNVVAQALFARDGEFKPRSVKRVDAFKRRPKNARQAENEWGG